MYFLLPYYIMRVEDKPLNDVIDDIIKGVDDVMGGKVLNYEAKDILNQGKREVAEELLKLGKNSFEEIAQCTGMKISEVENLAEKLGIVVPV